MIMISATLTAMLDRLEEDDVLPAQNIYGAV